MTDIVTRLRDIAGPLQPNVCTEAADEIERLRAAPPALPIVGGPFNGQTAAYHATAFSWCRDGVSHHYRLATHDGCEVRSLVWRYDGPKRPRHEIG